MINKSRFRFIKYLFTDILLLLCVLPVATAQEQDTLEYQQPAVLITATRSPVQSILVNRSFDIAELTIFDVLTTTSIGDILQQYANVNVQSRGSFGMQTDLSIRGALFSQNLILLNGTRLDDPQTAHHNFDLPVTLEQVERIEILRGPSSSQYGANAFGGIINIITRKPETTSTTFHLSGGEHGLLETGGILSAAWSGIKSSNNISYARNDGYKYDTDFSTLNLSSLNQFISPFGTIDLCAGFTKKDFGAFDFYSPGKNKPSKEWTETSFFSIGSTISLSSLQLVPKISYRQHYDKFMDDLRTPNQNVNIHTTHVIQSELVGIIKIAENCTATAGTECTRDDISSNAYGQHIRNSGAVFTSLHSRLNKWTLDAGLRTDIHSDYGTQFSPTAGMGYIFSSQGKVYATIGRSFRAPTYTELYMNNPNFIGDPSLHPETGWSYETGLEYYLNSKIQWNFSVFEHNQANLIDYVKYTAQDRYQVENFTNASTRGIEVSTQWNEPAENNSKGSMFLERIHVAYGYLDSYIQHKPVYSTRYSFTHPRHQVSILIIGMMPFNAQASIGVVHKIKLSGISYTLVDARLAKHFSIVDFYVSGSNLLNQSYEEIVGVPLPGRWLLAGVEVKIL